MGQSFLHILQGPLSQGALQYKLPKTRLSINSLHINAVFYIAIALLAFDIVICLKFHFQLSEKRDGLIAQDGEITKQSKALLKRLEKIKSKYAHYFAKLF